MSLVTTGQQKHFLSLLLLLPPHHTEFLDQLLKAMIQNLKPEKQRTAGERGHHNAHVQRMSSTVPTPALPPRPPLVPICASRTSSLVFAPRALPLPPRGSRELCSFHHINWDWN